MSNFPARFICGGWTRSPLPLPQRGKRAAIIRTRASSSSLFRRPTDQEWSHLIFAGWNEGSWPPPETGEFARQDEIDAFNRSIQKLNLRASRQGRQGEGHTAIRDNHTLYLGPAQQRQIALRQFETLVQSATQKIAFTASLVQEDAPERLWNPSELFTRHYQEANNSPLTQKAMNQLQALTRSWLDKTRDPKRSDLIATPEIRSTRIAYDARRDPNVPSPRIRFCIPFKAARHPYSKCERFRATHRYARLCVWLKKYLGVKAADESENVWNSSTGKWVHDWLAAIATEQRRRLHACRIPPKWNDAFAPLRKRNAPMWRIFARPRENRCLIGGPAAGATLSFSRAPSPKNWDRSRTGHGWQPNGLSTKISLSKWPKNATLSLRGRIDLLLARQGTEPGLARRRRSLDHRLQDRRKESTRHREAGC